MARPATPDFNRKNQQKLLLHLKSSPLAHFQLQRSAILHVPRNYTQMQQTTAIHPTVPRQPMARSALEHPPVVLFQPRRPSLARHNPTPIT